MLIVALGLAGCAGPGSPDRSPGVAATEDGGEALTPEEFIAGQQLADDGAGGHGDDVTCRWERPLGSHIRKKVCKSAVEREREEIEARHLMKTRQEVMRE